MRVAGIRDGVIAAKLGLSQSGLSRIVALPEYQDLEQATLLGVTSKMDEALAGRVQALKDYFERSVPVALRTMFEVCQQRRDLRAALNAASEICDRDPKKTFAKSHASLGADAPGVPAELLNTIAADADKVVADAKKVVN